MARPALSDPTLQGEIIEIIASSPSAVQPIMSNMKPRHRPDLDVECVLFDVYGTMFMSASGDVGTAQASSTEENFARALERAGLILKDKAAGSRARALFFEEIGRRHSADRSRGVDFPEVDASDIWRVLLSRLLDAGLVALKPGISKDSASLRAATWYETLSNPVAPMPGIGTTLESLRSAGYRLGIVSNAQFYTPLLFPALLGRTHAELGFRDDLCAWSYLVGRAKPSTGIFSPLLERLERTEGILPESVLYVGNDMLNDVWTAKSSGCRTALFAGDTRSLRLREDDPRCAGLVPDIVILNLPDLAGALGAALLPVEEGNTE